MIVIALYLPDVISTQVWEKAKAGGKICGSQR
jgi:hypothetical protein